MGTSPVYYIVYMAHVHSERDNDLQACPSIYGIQDTCTFQKEKTDNDLLTRGLLSSNTARIV